MATSGRLTPEQDKALKTRTTSVALRAGAGCGKTHVLTKRFLSHVDPDDSAGRAQLHQLVAITFTDAAAREMRRRIRDECYDQSVKAKEPHSQDDWLRLLREIDTARVSTIHAFCRSLLAAHALEAGLDPTFGVLEQGEADVLVSEVIDDVLREKLAATDESTLELAAASGLSQLKLQIRALLVHRHETEFADWQTRSEDELVATWQSHYDNTTFASAVREIGMSAAAQSILQLLANDTLPTGKQSFLDAQAALQQYLPQLADGSATENDVLSISGHARINGVCTVKEWRSKEAYEQYRDACKELRESIERFPTRPRVDSAREAAHLGLQLLKLTADVADEYERRKGGLNLDYDDLLARAYQLLTDPQHATLRAEFADQLQLLLVDEFQDTDQLQTNLVKTLCGDRVDAGKLFFVGDINQSIYRFRGAQPEVFQELMQQVPQAGRLPLSVNFRSQPAILNFVNATFFNNLGDGYVPLQPNRPQTTAEPAVEFLWAHTPNKRPGVKGAMREARIQEARWIARRIRQLMEQETPMIAAVSAEGEPRQRPLELRDIAILFRALSDVDVYESALREFGLDYYLVGGHAFYSQQEIFDVLNLLRAIASPADEISLAGALRSPFFSLTDESLYWLAERTGSLNDGLFGERLPAQLTPVEHRKAIAAASTLAHLRQQKDLVPITALLSDALARTGYDAALLSEFLGERKLANLNKLLEQARAADAGGALDLSGFIAQLSEFTARQPKEALAATLSESENVIRLMTIHHAKGLEFPLVIVPDLDRKPDHSGPDAAFDPQLGPLLRFRADDDDEPRATTGMDLFRAREKQADAEERRRLLYVACTRAADYLMLSSSIANFDKPESDWVQLLADQFELTTGALRVELPTGHSPARIGVTLQEPAVAFRAVGRARGANLDALVESARAEAEAGGGTVPRDVFPVPVDTSARSRFSVSRLSGKIFPYDPAQAALLRELSAPTIDSVDPRDLGVLVHSVLEHIEFARPEQIAARCEQMASEVVLRNADRAAALAREMVDRLVASPRWALMAAAPSVHRELEFLLRWPPGESHAEGRYLQGYIDCLYQDAAGGWHLVDYKTNDIPAAAVPKVAQQYEMQMLVYALAAERALGQPPVELVLNFLRPGVEFTFHWNDPARRRGIQLVNEAITAVQTPVS